MEKNLLLVSSQILTKGLTFFNVRAIRRHITGTKAESRDAPGKPRAVDIQMKDGIKATAPLEVPTLSYAVFEILIR